MYNPLHRFYYYENYTVIRNIKMSLHKTYNISSLIVDVIFNALWSHPPNGDLLAISFFTLIATIVVPIIHVLRQSKVSYLDHSMLVNPACSGVGYCGLTSLKTNQCEMKHSIIISKHLCCTYIQFLAARSR